MIMWIISGVFQHGTNDIMEETGKEDVTFLGMVQEVR